MYDAPNRFIIIQDTVIINQLSIEKGNSLAHTLHHNRPTNNPPPCSIHIPPIITSCTCTSASNADMKIEMSSMSFLPLQSLTTHIK